MFRRLFLTAVAVVVAGVGFAVAADAISVELKDFKIKSDYANNDDGVALNEADGKIQFYSNGTAIATIKVSEGGEYDILIEASCDAAEKKNATMTVKVDDIVVKENLELTTVDAKTYTFTTKLKKGDVKLSIAFTNDVYKENEFDRNLYVHKVKIDPKK